LRHGDPTDFVPGQHDGDMVVIQVGLAPGITSLLALAERLIPDFHDPTLQVDDPVSWPYSLLS
jgi:hypothetical protein